MRTEAPPVLPIDKTRLTGRASAADRQMAGIRDDLLERVCDWLNRARRRKPEFLNSIVLLRFLVEDAPFGITGLGIDERLNKERGWAKRQINRLRDELEDFRTGAGANLPWRLAVETTEANSYRVFLRANAPQRSAEAVWLPHLWGCHDGNKPRTNWITLTEPRRFRDSASTSPTIGIGTEAFIPQLGCSGRQADTPKPCSEFVALGDVLAHRIIENGLREIRVDARVELATNQDKTWNELCTENFILIGPWHSNELIRQFQETERRLVLLAAANGVKVRSPLSALEAQLLSNEDSRCHDSEARAGKSRELRDRQGRAYFGVFTRISDRVSGQVKTAIVSNHGAASEAIARYLFSAEVERSLSPAMQEGDKWRGLHDNYQLLFKVTLAVGTERKGTAKLLMVRSLSNSIPV